MIWLKLAKKQIIVEIREK